MHITIELLRLLHIVGGVLWVGALVLLAFFITPAAGALGPAGGAMMNQLSTVQKMPQYIMGTAIVAVLAGLALFGLDASGTGGHAWMRSGMGMTLGVGGLIAIIALIMGVTTAVPLARRLGARAAAMAQAGRPPSEAEQAAFQADFARLSRLTRTGAILVLIATAAMALARYMP